MLYYLSILHSHQVRSRSFYDVASTSGLTILVMTMTTMMITMVMMTLCFVEPCLGGKGVYKGDGKGKCHHKGKQFREAHLLIDLT